jgi:DNA-directed RNA polymerase specialized sigma24 family protein
VVAVTRTIRVEAVASREGDWWVIDVTGYGATQVRRLDDVEPMVADLVASLENTDVSEVEVTNLVVRLNGDLDVAVREARAAVKAAAEAQKQAGQQQRELVRQLRARNLSVREVASVLGVTPGRVSQLARTPPAGRRPTDSPTRLGA